ncbi:uncharacterized protein yc1106_03778 [Curvularia clavata]|uniref:Uncharacterized protein n=1 Tax=Curvularia clavata TaxID=95742 RepID=A0A9Q8Z7V0_CURCL|nr:uncharacterized protein yc1106_03778 [Curvularia clavata]
MMTMAMDRVRELEKDFRWVFGWPYLPDAEVETERMKFERAVDSVRDAFHRTSNEMTTTENGLKTFSDRSLTESQRNALFIGPPDTLCPECCPEDLRPMINKAIESLDVCGEFLVQQHLFWQHWDLFDPDETDEAEDIKSRELERYTIFSGEIPQQAGAILESFIPTDFGNYVRSIGLYHFDLGEIHEIGGQLKSIDCLGRTPLHRFLDDVFESGCDLPYQYFDESGNSFVDKGSWNNQDILGRTPFHILCQSPRLDGYGEVEVILEAGANPSLATIYGSLPLHYVAANGNFKICEVLMKHESKFNIGAADMKGLTALDYAIIKKHEKVADLLMGHYNEAGLSREIVAAFRIKNGIEDGHHVF